MLVALLYTASWLIQPAVDTVSIRAAAGLCIDEFETLELPLLPYPGWKKNARDKAIDEWSASREKLLKSATPHALLVALRNEAESGRYFEGVDDSLLGFAEVGLLPAPPETKKSSGDAAAAAAGESDDGTENAAAAVATATATEAAAATPALFPYLANLAVKAGARRLGLGRELVLATERAAVEMGHDRLYIKVDRQNFEARRLYDRLGYQLVYLQPRLDPRKGPPGANLFLRKDGLAVS